MQQHLMQSQAEAFYAHTHAQSAREVCTDLLTKDPNLSLSAAVTPRFVSVMDTVYLYTIHIQAQPRMVLPCTCMTADNADTCHKQAAS